MKTARILLTAVLLVASASVYVRAQERKLLTATIPFAFTVENTSLPAGNYTFAILAPYNMMKVQSADDGKVAMIYAVPTPKSVTSQQSKLVFNRLGNQYFLSQLWEQGGNVRRDLRSGNLARELARRGEKIQSTTIVASTGKASH